MRRATRRRAGGNVESEPETSSNSLSRHIYHSRVIPWSSPAPFPRTSKTKKLVASIKTASEGANKFQGINFHTGVRGQMRAQVEGLEREESRVEGAKRSFLFAITSLPSTFLPNIPYLASPSQGWLCCWCLRKSSSPAGFSSRLHPWLTVQIFAKYCFSTEGK